MATRSRKAPAARWPDAVFDTLVRDGITQVAWVPDAGHARLIERCERSRKIRGVVLTTEEEGVAMLCGSWLGGARGALLMQSSGVGNCINMFGMVRECRFPLLMLVTMRGEWGEFNSWQVPMGEGTRGALENAGVLVRTIDDAALAAETVGAASRLAFSTYRAVAVLIAQRVLGSKAFR